VTGELSPFASKLAAAVARRHALDQIAETGMDVPAGLLQDAEARIRAAEGELKQARAAQ
jgi:NAD(P)H-dependent flavin oxidoreductase YrpB (nitropropane dioxygenase family)